MDSKTLPIISSLHIFFYFSLELELFEKYLSVLLRAMHGRLNRGLKGFLRSDLLVGGGNLAAPIGQGHERGTARLRTTI